MVEWVQVLENTIGIAGNLPDSEVFSRPDTSVYGRDGLVRKAGRMAIPMFSTSRPPVPLENGASGFQSRIGVKTMTTVTSPSTPTTGNPIARQQAIENTLSLALWHIRQDYAPGHIHAAMVKAVRASAMLKQACTEAPQGRA